LQLEDKSESEDESITGTDAELADDYLQLIEEIKFKISKADSKAEEVQLLTLAPKSWSGNKIAKEFHVSRYLSNKSKHLRTQKGIMSEIGKKQASKLSTATLEAVELMYHDDEYTRSFPGMKDALSVRIEGERVKKQKRLISCDLKELHTAYLDRHKEAPEHKIGFSTFAKLRPKWCVLAGSPGTHSVCVCSYHQNVKLMIAASKIDRDYKDLLSLMVCSLTDEDCMLGICQNCPGIEPVKELLLEDEDLGMLNEITYSEWKTGEHCQLATNVIAVEEFIELLVSKIFALKSHHYVSKHQAKQLSILKENLDNETCILLGDFAENYTFVAQNAVQSFYWTNTQATLHPFVAYVVSPDTNVVKPLSMCIISDCSQKHTTSAVYAFQKVVVPYLKSVATFKKIIYWSDGAAGQYKNKIQFCESSES